MFYNLLGFLDFFWAFTAAHKNYSLQRALQMAVVDVLFQNAASKGSEGRTEENDSSARGSGHKLRNNFHMCRGWNELLSAH